MAKGQSDHCLVNLERGRTPWKISKDPEGTPVALTQPIKVVCPTTSGSMRYACLAEEGTHT